MFMHHVAIYYKYSKQRGERTIYSVRCHNHNRFHFQYKKMTSNSDSLIDKPETMVSKFTCTSVEQSPNFRSQRKQWLASISATLTMVAVGTVYGWSTVIVGRLEMGGDVPIKITEEETSWVLGLTVISSMFGSFLAAFLADLLGRKICLLCSTLFFVIGWLNIIFGTNVIALYAARTILGVGVSMSYTTNPMYVSEVADINIRGALETLIAVNVFTGSLLACSVGPFVSYNTFNFILLSVPIIFVATFIWFPETPYYLAMKNRHQAALHSIAFFKGIDIDSARDELQIILNDINESKEQSEDWKIKIRRLFAYNNRKAFLMILFLIAAQQLSGNFTTMQYLTQLFSRAQIGIAPSVATIIVTAVGLVSGTFSTMTVERAGRRILLMISTLGCAITLLIFAIYLYLDNIKMDLAAINILPVIAIVLFQIAFQFGLGTLPNALVGELFPTNAKGVAAAGITISDGIIGFIVIKLYSTIEYLLGNFALYFFFAGFSFVAFIFVALCIPETKNKSFSEIQEELSRRGFRYRSNATNHSTIQA